ncbi:HAD-like domain-containing protein [Absidia repens]|uniref:Mitochondrial import inner membrane translocase subunit TIM50 n=1 Tax=Absidia repens TaxID=90262 RepID=A0A1X2IE89_9FUNG|nr:HAD-like domain-containing protein [Absidia repens]
MVTVRNPSKGYLDQANVLSKTLDSVARPKQLLILDLNGTLVSRMKSTGSLYLRPYHNRFFDYIFDNFTVMVWSSARPHNVDKMCRIFGEHRKKLRLIWDRTNFGLSTKDYNSKVVTIKDLEFIWKSLPDYDATNTILMDDSPEKTILQPHNHCVVSEFDHHSSTFRNHGEYELASVQSYLEKVQYQDNVSNYIKNHPYVSPANATNSNSNGDDDDDDNDDDDNGDPSDDSLPGVARSTQCYHYIFNKYGEDPAPILCDLGTDDLTARVSRLQL